VPETTYRQAVALGIAQEMARDPIPAQRARLVAAGVDAAALDEVDAETRAKIAEAEAFARAGAEPSPEVIETQVWADGGSSWRSDRG